MTLGLQKDKNYDQCLQAIMEELQERETIMRNNMNNEMEYSKTCVKWPLKNRQNKGLLKKTNGSLMKVESSANCPL